MLKMNGTNNFIRIDQAVAWRLCMGCGACKYACANEAITLIDIPERGIRPNVDSSKCQRCGNCLGVCPGIELSHQPFNSKTIPELLASWGPVLEVWEGYAADPKIRFEASSGGAATALALFCLEKENFSGVLHIGTKAKAPLQNVPVFSKTREELLACTGSRYSPAAPCAKLNCIQEAKSSCVFIGKPCDVAALSQHIPAVGIAYSKKFYGVFESVGVGYCVVDARNTDIKRVFEIIESAYSQRVDIQMHLQKRIPSIAKTALSIFNELK